MFVHKEEAAPGPSDALGRLRRVTMRSGLLLTAAAVPPPSVMAVTTVCDQVVAGWPSPSWAASATSRAAATDAKSTAAAAINASHPLTRAWIRVTSKSLRKHVREPLAEAYASAAYVFVYSWDKTVRGLFRRAF